MSFVFLFILVVLAICMVCSYTAEFIYACDIPIAKEYYINDNTDISSIEYTIRCLEYRHKNDKNYFPLIHVHTANDETARICLLLNRKYKNIELI